MQSSASNRCHTSGNQPPYLHEGLSSKKTTLIILIVVGCIAILWPRVFHPMMFGVPAITSHSKETPRSFGGCCDVVLNRVEFYNTTLKESASSIINGTFGPQIYRKSFSPYNSDDIISIRQERPAHLYPDSVYQAMRERGRAILPTNTLTTSNKVPSTTSKRIIDGKRGPIPGMRPPMGGGAMIQPQAKTSSMGLIMPLYTIGIVVFFGYTIMKIAFKKPIPNAPYGVKPSDANFRKEVFSTDATQSGSELVMTAIQGIIDAADEELKLREATSSRDAIKQSSNDTSTIHSTSVNKLQEDNPSERTMAVLEMEVSASCENGQKWANCPPTPIVFSNQDRGRKTDESSVKPKSIYLEGSLGPEAQILISDADIKHEPLSSTDADDSSIEPATVLSSKMTLSLINFNLENIVEETTKN